MKKIIFGIFAHPDDEAFGPAGALLSETRAGTELHLITFTYGDQGTNPDNVQDLGNVREIEWRQAGELLGATSMHSLGYKDGHLNNLAMIEATTRIIDIVTSIIRDAPSDTRIEFMTLDTNGYTGHIDHIVVARSACLAFYRLKERDQRIARIRLACLSDVINPKINTDWIYMEAGHTPDEINEIVDARQFRDDIIAVMKVHHSQRHDCEATIKNQGTNLGLNYFIVKT
jgi:LmbE family N-acetylglucosaminyl deacetylase